METVKDQERYELCIYCPVTGKLVRTGFVTSGLEAFKTSTLDTNTSQCSACGNFHVWQKQDVLLVQIL